MKIIVFLGPSLPPSEAHDLLPTAIFLPPAQQSDVISALYNHRPDAIAIIDGVFFQSLAVWHKEILFALNQGIPVFGASSIGALRAIETERYGMVGMGWVYEQFHNGTLTGDDEVALAHGTAETDYINTSVPLVNIRATLAAAVQAGIIDTPTETRLLHLTKNVYFPDRTYPNLYYQANQDGISTTTIKALQAFVAENRIDAKADDARQLLRHLAHVQAGDASLPQLPDFDLIESANLIVMSTIDRSLRRPTGHIDGQELAHYVALHMPDYQTLNFQAMNRAVLLLLAQQLDITPPNIEQRTQAEKRRFRIRFQLRTTEDLEAWLRDNDLLPSDFDRLMRENATLRHLHQSFLTNHLHDRNVGPVLDLLKLTNQYNTWANRAAEQAAAVDTAHPDFWESDYHEENMHDLVLEHAHATGWRTAVPFNQWYYEAGFNTLLDLKAMLMRAKLHREQTQET
jgi:hypothetical protein